MRKDKEKLYYVKHGDVTMRDDARSTAFYRRGRDTLFRGLFPGDVSYKGRIIQGTYDPRKKRTWTVHTRKHFRGIQLSTVPGIGFLLVTGNWIINKPLSIHD
jgi:hypothetical protein